MEQNSESENSSEVEREIIEECIDDMLDEYDNTGDLSSFIEQYRAFDFEDEFTNLDKLRLKNFIANHPEYPSDYLDDENSE